MVRRMKTTLILDDMLHKRLRQAAARRGMTMSELVEGAVRRMLDEVDRPTAEMSPLPSFDGGKLLVDVADRDALYRAMEENG